MRKRSNAVASRQRATVSKPCRTEIKNELKKARQRKTRDKVKLCILAVALVPGILGGELSMFKHPATRGGTIQSVDLPAHSLLLVSKLQPDPITITWVEDTEFFVEGIKSDPEKLRPQMKATVLIREPFIFPDKVLKISAYTKKQVHAVRK